MSRAVESVTTKRKQSKPGKSGKKSKPKKPQRTAKNADKFELYQLSVQDPETDALFYREYFNELVGRPAEVLREDFSGTSLLCCEWVKLEPRHRSIGVELDPETIAWAREHNVDSRLEEEQKGRVTLLEEDVRTVKTQKADIIAALNFSYCFFMTRDELRNYFKACKTGLKPDGILILDSWGGSETQVDEMEEDRRIKDKGGNFTYVWEQRDFDPVTYQSECRIHFTFDDGSEIRDAFGYRWRQWTLPELQELMTEAGFHDVHVLWEGTDGDGDGDGEYFRADRGDADPSWIAYVVGRKNPV
ncbi:MAG: class I SAM-dependent methyltransferase [Planctomycetota bacterium]